MIVYNTFGSILPLNYCQCCTLACSKTSYDHDYWG